MPLKYTSVPPSWVGREVCERSAEAVADERFVPMIDTIVPGAIEAASPPPVSVLAATPAPIVALVERVVW